MNLNAATHFCHSQQNLIIMYCDNHINPFSTVMPADCTLDALDAGSILD